MAYKDAAELLNDPDFQQSKPETQRWALKTQDPKSWGQKNDTEIDAFLTRMRPNWKRENDRLQSAVQQSQQLPPPTPPEAKKTKWEQAVAPVTDYVGMGMEALTTPLVGAARVMQGETPQAAVGPETWKSVGQGGVAAQKRQQAASGVVPQSPWQAGAMAAQFVPGLGAATKAAPALGRIGAAAIGGGGLQALLGSEGLLEGNTNAVGEGLAGALKGGGTQAVGEGVGKALGGVARGGGIPFLHGAIIRYGENKRIGKAVGGVVPEFKQVAKKGPQALGEFMTGTHGAEKAAGGAYSGAMNQLEQTLVKETGQPYINATVVDDLYKMLAKRYKGNPAFSQQVLALKKAPGGYLPEQVKDILALTRDVMKLDNSATGKFSQTALDNVVAEIEASLPKAAQGILTAGRKGYAKAEGLRELLAPHLKPDQGYKLDVAGLQRELSTNPALAERLGPGELEKFLKAATGGAGLGYASKTGPIPTPGGYASKWSQAMQALRVFMRRGTHVGELPYTLPQGAKAGLGVAATATAGQKEK